jgi:uncharacterized protein YggE
MKNSALVAGLLLAAVMSASAQTPAPDVQKRTVTVRGEGRVTAPPDQVRLTLQVNVRGESATEAMRSASTKTQSILALLKSFGVEEKNIQSSRITVTPVLDYSRQVQPPPIVGYTSSNDFTVVFKGTLMDRVGEFIDRAVTVGAMSFGSLQFENSKQREMERDALGKAAADARARAQQLARELGATLGPVISIAEAVAERPGPVLMRSMAEGATAAPVMTGELSIVANVDVVFELK